MEFDPASRDGPPPRHAIESDSEDSDVEDTHRTKKPTRNLPFEPPKIELRLVDDHPLPVALPLIALIGGVGEAYVRGLVDPSWHVRATLVANGEEQAALALDSAGKTYVALVHPDASLSSEQASYAYICEALLSAVRPSEVIIVDEYHTAMYINTAPTEIVDESFPIRVLHSYLPSNSLSSKANLAAFSAPNYITGLGASFTSEASIAGIPASTLLVPQQSHFNPHLQRVAPSHVLDKRPEPLSDVLVERITALIAPHWQSTTGEKADETLSLDNFLLARRSKARKQRQAEISAMYT